MGIRTIEQGLEALAEKVKDCEKRLNQMANQRRLQVVDLFGIEFIGTTTEDKKVANYNISISPDMVYLERFQFKIFMIDESQNPTNFTVSINGIDITDYLKLQASELEDGHYMGQGTKVEIYPKKAFNDDSDTPNNLNGSFDLIDIANLLCDEDRDDDANKILTSGIKKITIRASKEFTASILLYLKYSHLNR